MLDVHAPEHRISGKRDFLIHLLTITVGLLIALALENAAEAVHHRHERHEAEDTIRQELTQNRDRVLEARDEIKREMVNMVGVLDFIQAREAGQTGSVENIDISFHEIPMQDSAWRTAGSTGVLSYMDYNEARRFSLAYKEQDLFESMQQQALNNYLELDSFIVKGFDPTTAPVETLREAKPHVRLALAHLRGMQDVSTGALKAYEDALRTN